jgi:hypothetical protein
MTNNSLKLIARYFCCETKLFAEIYHRVSNIFQINAKIPDFTLL